MGHAFVGFQKFNTDGTSVTQVMGFYPGASGLGSDGVINDDGGHEFDVSYSSNVTEVKFQIALNNVISDNILEGYILSNNAGNQYNCTDAAINWIVNAGVNLPPDALRGIFKNTPGDYG